MLSLRDQCFSFFTIFVHRVSNIRYLIWLSICVCTAYTTYESDPGGRAERPYKAALPTTIQIVLSLPFFTRNIIRTTNLLPLQCYVESHIIPSLLLLFPFILAVSRRYSRRLSSLLSPSLAVSRRCSRRLSSPLSSSLSPYPLDLRSGVFFFLS